MNPENPTGADPAPDGIFATTQWTRILASRGDSPQAHQALGDLCAAYYLPVFVLMRRAARNEENARDLTQEFFARLLSGHGLAQADPQRGRFRFFLLGAVKHFLADVRDRRSRLKRGGGQSPLSLDSARETSPALQVADTSLSSPELEFDRQWALTFLARALDRLSGEQAAAGKAAQFQALKPWLIPSEPGVAQGEVAARLGTTPGP